MNLTRTEAEKIRSMLQIAAESLTDEQALKAPLIFERWAADQHYPVGKRLYHSGKLWRVLIEHTSQTTWTPDVSPSLFAEVLIPDPSVIPEWVQPSSTNPYMKDDKVRHNGKIWISIADYNVWEPGVYGWEEITN